MLDEDNNQNRVSQEEVGFESLSGGINFHDNVEQNVQSIPVT